MISYIKGEITFKNPTYVIVEAGGIGYHLNISLHTYAKVEKLENVKLLTFFHVKEDAQTLYGFAEDSERQLFIKLISVSGIGPNTARIILSSMTAEETRAAIISEDVLAFKKVKGVGPKTAKRIILDLKDKILKESDGQPALVAPGSNTIRDEALSALLALGFNRIKVQKTLNNILTTQPGIKTVEDLIKVALKNLS